MADRSLKRVIALQQLSKARLDMAIAMGSAKMATLRLEDEALIAMQNRQMEMERALVDPVIVLNRLGRNAVLESEMENTLAMQRQSRLQVSRRLDVLLDRLTEYQSKAERAEMAGLIEDFVSARKRSSEWGHWIGL